MPRITVSASALRKSSDAYMELFNDNNLQIFALKGGRFEVVCGSTHAIAHSLQEVADKVNAMELHACALDGNEVIASIQKKLGSQYRLEIHAAKDDTVKVVHSVEGSKEALACDMAGSIPVDVSAMNPGQRYALSPNMFGGDYAVLIPMNTLGLPELSPGLSPNQMWETQPLSKGDVVQGICPITGEVIKVMITNAYPNGSIQDNNGKIYSADEVAQLQFCKVQDSPEPAFSEPDLPLYDSGNIPTYNPTGEVEKVAPMIGNLANYNTILEASGGILGDFMRKSSKFALADKCSLNKIRVSGIDKKGQATDGDLEWNVKIASPYYQRSSYITIPMTMVKGDLNLGKYFIASTGQKFPLTVEALDAHLGRLADDPFAPISKQSAHPSTLKSDPDIDAICAAVASKKTASLTDANGEPIAVGDKVLVPEPEEGDIWIGEFEGRVDSQKDATTLTVIDGDDDAWDVDANRLLKLSSKKTAGGESWDDVVMQQEAITSSETKEEAVQKLKDMGYVSTFSQTGEPEPETIEECVDRVWDLYKDPAWDELNKEGSKKAGQSQRPFVQSGTEKTASQKASYGDNNIQLTELDNGNLKISLVETSDKEDIARRLEERGSDATLYELMDSAIGNMWAILSPEDVGALTDSPILAYDVDLDDKGNRIVHAESKVWWFPNYQVEDPIQTLLDKGAVIFTKAQDAPTGTDKEGSKKTAVDAKEVAEKVLEKDKPLDNIPGGKAEGEKPSNFDKDQLEKGIKVEMEHTDNPEVAAEIATDHLAESPAHDKAYYDKLETKVEKPLEQKAETMASKRKVAMTDTELKAQGFILTDDSTNQWVKKVSDTEFEIFESGELNTIDLADYSEEDLENMATAYYGGGLKEIRETYGAEANQIIAEIISETEFYSQDMGKSSAKEVVAWDFTNGQDIVVGDTVSYGNNETGKVINITRVQDVYDNEDEFDANQETYGNEGLSWEGNEIMTVDVGDAEFSTEKFIYEVKKVSPKKEAAKPFPSDAASVSYDPKTGTVQLHDRMGGWISPDLAPAAAYKVAKEYYDSWAEFKKKLGIKKMKPIDFNDKYFITIGGRGGSSDLGDRVTEDIVENIASSIESDHEELGSDVAHDLAMEIDVDYDMDKIENGVIEYVWKKHFQSEDNNAVGKVLDTLDDEDMMWTRLDAVSEQISLIDFGDIESKVQEYIAEHQEELAGKLRTKEMKEQERAGQQVIPGLERGKASLKAVSTNRPRLAPKTAGEMGDAFIALSPEERQAKLEQMDENEALDIVRSILINSNSETNDIVDRVWTIRDYGASYKDEAEQDICLKVEELAKDVLSEDDLSEASVESYLKDAFAREKIKKNMISAVGYPSNGAKKTAAGDWVSVTDAIMAAETKEQAVKTLTDAGWESPFHPAGQETQETVAEAVERLWNQTKQMSDPTTPENRAIEIIEKEQADYIKKIPADVEGEPDFYEGEDDDSWSSEDEIPEEEREEARKVFVLDTLSTNAGFTYYKDSLVSAVRAEVSEEELSDDDLEELVADWDTDLMRDLPDNVSLNYNDGDIMLVYLKPLIPTQEEVMKGREAEGQQVIPGLERGKASKK